jgi:hypothetical protein
VTCLGGLIKLLEWEVWHSITRKLARLQNNGLLCQYTAAAGTEHAEGTPFRGPVALNHLVVHFKFWTPRAYKKAF